MINQFNLSTYQFFPLNVPSLNQPKATTKGLYSANGGKPELASSPLAEVHCANNVALLQGIEIGRS